MADESGVSAEQILADPGSYTVEQVTSALAGATSEEVAQVKLREAEGRDRRGIAEWEDPALVAAANPSFQTDEQFAVEGWKERAGWFGVSPHHIAGALADTKPGEALSQAQVAQRLERFAKRQGVAE